jgi:hypothetical protein
MVIERTLILTKLRAYPSVNLTLVVLLRPDRRTSKQPHGTKKLDKIFSNFSCPRVP